MRDTIIIANRKSDIKSDLPFVHKVVSRSDFNPSEINNNIKYIICIDKGVKLNEDMLTSLYENADSEHVTVGIYEKNDRFSAVRRLYYSFAGVSEADSVGALLFPACFESLLLNVGKLDTVRLLSLAHSAKHEIKRIVMVGSGKRELSLGSIKSYFSIFLSSRPLKYLFSSFVAFVIDYALLMLLDDILPIASLEIGAFLAWCVSSAVNFLINRSFVFKSNASMKASLIEYYSLAVAVFAVKTYVIIELLTRLLTVPLIVAKPIAEVLLFVLNYFIQKKFIFGKQKRLPQKSNNNCENL